MSLRKQTLKNLLPPIAPSKPMSSSGMKKLSQRRDYTPKSWKKYFDKADNITDDNGDVFRVYRSGNSGPLLLLLHGGGYSGLTWSLFTESILTMVNCQVAAVDLRGHGSTKCKDEDDLSADTLAQDISNIVSHMYAADDIKPPGIVIIGHSMGGALVVHTAYKQLIPSLIGMAVIDVVEGTAMDSLNSMQSFLRGRPSIFKSIEHAVEWCIRSGQVRNVQSARISMPAQIKNIRTNCVATEELTDGRTRSQSEDDECHLAVEMKNSIPEEDEDVTSPQEPMPPNINHAQSNRTAHDKDVFKEPRQISSVTIPIKDQDMNKYTWRIELSKSEKFWPGWFGDLSTMFLSCDVPKLLLLAGIDRLDRELTIGQMQGKFQMQVLPQCGHAVHEDVPDRVAEVIATFLVRHKFAEPKSDFEITLPAC